LAILGYVCLLAQDSAKPVTPANNESTYTPVHQFDPARDAAADIERAISEARRTRKRILVDVGGDWCSFCHALNHLFQQHRSLLELRDKGFITVAVYYGDENKNEQVLSKYSKVLGIPHIFVLDQDGALLHSQHVADFQVEGNYSPEQMRDFLSKWSPGSGDSAKSN